MENICFFFFFRQIGRFTYVKEEKEKGKNPFEYYLFDQCLGFDESKSIGKAACTGDMIGVWLKIAEDRKTSESKSFRTWLKFVKFSYSRIRQNSSECIQVFRGVFYQIMKQKEA